MGRRNRGAGGRKDIDAKPQFMSGVVCMSGANTYTQVSMPMPVNQQGVPVGRARVVEIFRVWVDFAPDTLAEDGSIAAQITYGSESNLVAPTRPEAWILKFQADMQMVTSGAITLVTPFQFDLTDSKGNGVLVATDKLFLAALTGGQAAAINVGFKMLYKMTEVSQAEYIGIIQSQQVRT